MEDYDLRGMGVPVVDGVKHLPTGRYIHRDSRTAVSAYLILSDYASFIPIPQSTFLAVNHPSPLATLTPSSSATATIGPSLCHLIARTDTCSSVQMIKPNTLVNTHKIKWKIKITIMIIIIGANLPCLYIQMQDNIKSLINVIIKKDWAVWDA
ncbi:uncharacterized protein BO96DRAFT_438490 [Aspergillus niger CBS 101883]|uniref:Uncharacterized protein n=2 Tax=Aspergillus niger TaxID=5061 RepID=A2Q875_ASPNC|nr:uncharacterized protein BO96DRAFT_438490 [Aspergillus niger CBS 101883]XP_059599570.1 hypothetical protein An01g03320 [Aspergillus niger]PYH51986.1 hypothetical protein BO96DRAFT_438490 [Aspergillus niger CBS 101883]CAK36872.1 hypothetical protein An01g03320 [Aspergillus niger]